jgi:hypothetical protein
VAAIALVVTVVMGDKSFSSSVTGGDPHRRRPIERGAVRVERRPVHRLVACAARLGGVAAAVAEARLMTDQYLAGAEGVARGYLALSGIHVPIASICLSAPVRCGPADQ